MARTNKTSGVKPRKAVNIYENLAKTMLERKGKSFAKFQQSVVNKARLEFMDKTGVYYETWKKSVLQDAYLDVINENMNQLNINGSHEVKASVEAPKREKEPVKEKHSSTKVVEVMPKQEKIEVNTVELVQEFI